MPNTLITGARRGIGLALAAQLHHDGATVIAVCRTVSPALAALGVRTISDVDLRAPEGPAHLRAQVKGQKLDCVIMNAGVFHADALGKLGDAAAAQIREQFEVNALAPLLLVEALLENLEIGSKVVLISSELGSLALNDFGAHYGYRLSKAALNMVGKTLAVDLKHREIAVAMLHPGEVRTQMSGGRGNLSPEQSAALIVSRIAELTLAQSGTFWNAQGEILPW